MFAIEQHIALVQGFGSVHMGVLAMGFFYGLTLCSFSCIPVIAPYVFGTQRGFRSGFDVTAIFILTRVFTYTVMGAAAGAAGNILLDRISSGTLFPVAGAIILLIGMAVIFRLPGGCSKTLCRHLPDRKNSFVHMAALGVATSIMPCMPLTAVLVMGATTQSIVGGSVLALLFGIGTSASPLYYIGGATGWLSAKIANEIPRYSGHLQRLSGAILALFGLRLLMTWAAV